MTTDISLSLRTIEAQISSTQINVRDQSLSLVGRQAPANALNTQQQQIVDEVGISDEAIQLFEEAQRLANQLQAYNDYLFGGDRDNLVRLTEPNGQSTAVVSGRSSELAASITTASIREETLDINASFNESGDLQELSITRTETNIEYERIEVSLRDTQFFGAFQT